MEDIDKFFFKKNTVNKVSDYELSQTNDYLEVIKAFSRITYQSIYVIDYQQKSFEYVSDNPIFLCGHTAEEVKELGYAFYFKYVLPEDLDLLLLINQVGFNFFDRLPKNERKLYTISYDFSIVNQGKDMLINHKLTPMFLAKDGKIWKAICIVSLSPSSSSGNIVISKQGTDELWNYSVEEEAWVKKEQIKITEREKEILRLHMQGYTINDIAEKVFLSPDAIKFHRRKLFDKLNVDSITEALAYATHNKLI